MFRLATTKRLFQHRTRLETRMFRMWKIRSWSSALSSSGQSLMRARPTNPRSGGNSSYKQISSTNTQISLHNYCLGLMLVYSRYRKRLLHRINRQSSNIFPNSDPLSNTNLNKSVTLDHSHVLVLKRSLDLSKHHPLVSYPNQGNQENSVSSKIYPILIYLVTIYHQLIVPSTRTITHPHGAHLPSSASSSYASHLAHSWPYVMSKKPTE